MAAVQLAHVSTSERNWATAFPTTPRLFHLALLAPTARLFTRFERKKVKAHSPSAVYKISLRRCIRALTHDGWSIVPKPYLENEDRREYAVHGSLDFILAIDPGFPFDRPKVRLEKKPSFPLCHVESDGFLCLGDDGDYLVNPEDSIRQLVALTNDFLDRCQDREWAALEARRELERYWTSDTGNWPRLSINIDLSKTLPRNLDYQLQNGKCRISENSSKISQPTCVVRGTIPSKVKMPTCGADLRAWLDVKEQEFLCRALRKNPSVPFLVVVDVEDGEIVLGCSFCTCPRFGNGFRSTNKMDQNAFSSRLLGGKTQLRRHVVVREDRAWVLGRDRNERLADLSTKHVVVVGCGSLGSSVAANLARSGVGKMTLIDPENFQSENASRHYLGMDCEGQNKAKAMKDALRAQLPFVEVTALPLNWHVASREEHLFDCDLVVSMIGDPVSERQLGLIARTRQQDVLFAWMEARAIATHSLLCSQENGLCYACGFNAQGDIITKLVTWPEGRGTYSVPGCGNVFSPYGPTELSAAHSVVTAHVLDALLVGTPSPYRVLSPSTNTVTASQAEPTTFGRDHIFGEPRLQEVSWPSHECTWCSERLAL